MRLGGHRAVGLWPEQVQGRLLPLAHQRPLPAPFLLPSHNFLYLLEHLSTINNPETAFAAATAFKNKPAAAAKATSVLLSHPGAFISGVTPDMSLKTQVHRADVKIIGIL